MPLEFRRHAKDDLVQKMKGDTVRPKTMTSLMHRYTGSVVGKQRMGAARKKLNQRRTRGR